MDELFDLFYYFWFVNCMCLMFMAFYKLNIMLCFDYALHVQRAIQRACIVERLSPTFYNQLKTNFLCLVFFYIIIIKEIEYTRTYYRNYLSVFITMIQFKFQFKIKKFMNGFKRVICFNNKGRLLRHGSKNKIEDEERQEEDDNDEIMMPSIMLNNEVPSQACTK